MLLDSLSVYLQIPTYGVYSASKAAIDSLTRVAAAELAADKIQVYSINPFVFESELSDLAAHGAADAVAAMINPTGKIGKGSDLGRFLIDLIQGALASKYASGATIAVDSGNANWPLSEAVDAINAKAAAAAAQTAAPVQ
jgi:3-oxoacyl-[acyl-carrier protein] reductase